MMTVERTYTYRAKPDKGTSQAKIIDAMVRMGELLAKHNKYVGEVKVQLDGDEIEIRLNMLGHDQWWIKKRVIFPISQLLNSAGLKVDQARLMGVDNPNDKRQAGMRTRAADGHHNLPDADEMVDHSDMMA
jgi:ABC-type Fe3+-citrate transport system substrate-binding protein